MKDISGAALKVGLAAALLIVALLVSTAIAPAPSGQGIVKTETTVAVPGFLAVTVVLNNGSGAPHPIPGVSVGISQSLFRGLHLVFVTNRSGEVEIPLGTGQYGVTVSDPRFSLSNTVPVTVGTVTQMLVTVNRTTSVSVFTDAQDSTSAGIIEPWNSLVVEVVPGGGGVYFLLGGVGGSLVPVYFGVGAGGQVGQNLPKFGTEVFVQPERFYFNGSGLFHPGSEVASTVIAQVLGQGSAWLTLQPSKQLDLRGVTYLNIVSYEASSSVTFHSA